MDNRKTNDRQFILITLALAAGVMVISFLLFRLVAGRPPAEPSPPPSGPFLINDIDPIVSRSSSADGSTQKIGYKQGRAVYILTGEFVSPLVEDGDSLRGTFIIDADPSETEITVVIRSDRDDGKYPFARYTDAFGEGHQQASLESLETIVESVGPGIPAELRFMYHPTATRSTDEERAQEILEALLLGDWSLSPGTTLTPAGVGIVE